MVFYNNFDNVHGEDRYGMVGKTGDGFRENRQLEVSCYRCHKEPLVIAERNWMDTNQDDSQRYQIVVACEHCGFVAYNDLQSCIQWCEHAEECIGSEMYHKLVKNRKGGEA